MAALSESKFRAPAEVMDSAREAVLACGYQTLSEYIRIALEHIAETRVVPAVYAGRRSRVNIGRPRKGERNALVVRPDDGVQPRQQEAA